MLMPLEEAAKVFCVPEGHLHKLLVADKRLTRKRDDKMFVGLYDVAAVLGCPVEIVDLVAKGQEWLLAEHEIERLYGFNPLEMRKIAGGPAFYPRPHDPVYRVSPFIKRLTHGDLRTARERKEGVPNGTRTKRSHTISRAGVRGKV
jgi:hypothetical protein